jgi:nitrogen fixation NifU-like protein
MSSALYHTELVARAREAYGKGRLPDPAASITLDNPLCGDRVTLDLTQADGTVTAIGHAVKGCLLCEAAAATIAAFAPGRVPADLREFATAAVALVKEGKPPAEGFAALSVFTPVYDAKSRRECVLLPFEALGKALDAAF